MGDGFDARVQASQNVTDQYRITDCSVYGVYNLQVTRLRVLIGSANLFGVLTCIWQRAQLDMKHTVYIRHELCTYKYCGVYVNAHVRPWPHSKLLPSSLQIALMYHLEQHRACRQVEFTPVGP